MSKWSDFLRANMERKGWDGAQLARAANVTPSAISRWLSGGTRPTFDKVRSISDAFDVPIITALLAAEIITPEEAGVTPTIVDIETVDTADILKEIGKRLGVEAPTNVTQLRRPARDVETQAALKGETDELRRQRLTKAPEDVSQDPDDYDR